MCAMSSDKAIDVRDLVVGFGPRTVLKGVTFDVRRGVMSGRMRLWCPDQDALIQESEAISCDSIR